MQIYGSAGAFVGNRVVICSGYNYNGGGVTDECYAFEDNDDNDGSTNDGDDGIGKWTKLTENLVSDRGESAYAKMDENRFWITGKMLQNKNLPVLVEKA